MFQDSWDVAVKLKVLEYAERLGLAAVLMRQLGASKKPSDLIAINARIKNKAKQHNTLPRFTEATTIPSGLKISM